MDQKKTLTFLERLSEKAANAAHEGDTGLLNRMGANAALSHYYNNVYAIKAVTPDQWAKDYWQHVMEADRVREEYEQIEALPALTKTVSTLESKFDTLNERLTAYMEGSQGKKGGKALKEDAPPPAPKPTPKPTPKPPKPVDDDDSDGTVSTDDAEADSEEA